MLYIPSDTRQVNLETLFPAYLLASIEETKSNTTLETKMHHLR